MIPNSHGNGLVYSAEDDFLYGASDKLIWRYGTLSSASPTLTVDFFGSQGGVPLNTNSLDLESSLSQYAFRVDTATLSITGNLAIDAQIKPESLPAAGSQMVIASKWDESGTLRSYKFDINTVSGFFGDGSDGSLTISINVTDTPIDSVCTGTAGATTLSATNASFSSGQIILIHQSQGTNAGQYERNSIASYTAGTITLTTPLVGTYTTGAQVLVFKQYTNVTIDPGVTYSAKSWNGTTGGILGFVASGTFTNNGFLSATGAGFRGGAGTASNLMAGFGTGYTGEGPQGLGGQGISVNPDSGTRAPTNPGGGQGGGVDRFGSTGGGGGGHATAGGKPPLDGVTAGGTTYDVADATTTTFGSGGGGANDWEYAPLGGSGGNGGGFLYPSASTIINNGGITADGAPGQAGASSGGIQADGGGGGAAGTILLKAQTATLGASLITATGGAAGAGGFAGGYGGVGGNGYIVLNYYLSYTGTTSPTLNPIQDNTLVTNTSFQLRLSLSSTGLNSEPLAYVAPLLIDTWQQIGVSWQQSTKTATFYLNGLPIGTRVGTLGTIHDNVSRFAVGASFNGAGVAANFYDGLIDEVRIFNTTRSDGDMLSGVNTQIPVNTSGLVAYYKFNGDYTDSTGNANNLTPINTPVFTPDVPFPSPTTRLDIDKTGGGTGFTYAIPTTISEAAADRLTFTPGKDPQKSIQFNVGNIGTGTWTITIHDAQNNVIATSTVLNANMHTGQYEFIYANVWRPTTNFTNEYHAHITVTSGSPTVVTSVANDLETAQYTTYYQFLVEDAEWHPMMRFLNFWVVGNERYVGKYEATLYEPNKIVLQAGLRVRCFALWREYLAIGTQKGTNIQDFDSGRIYFWDGIAPTFNFFIDVPEGGINAMLGTKGKLYIWAGYKNQLLIYEGGDSASKVKDMPFMEATKFSEIYPQAVIMWQSLVRYGAAGNGDSLAVSKGVYTWGSTNAKYPDILTYDYPISTGSTLGTGVRVGLTAVVNRKLLIGWQDGIAFGMDYVDNANPPYTSAMIQFLIFDNEQVWKEKELVEVDVVTTPLLVGENISLSYALEGSTTFTPNPDPTVIDDVLSKMIITVGRYHEFQVQVAITSDTTSPTIKGGVAVSNSLGTEEQYG